MARGKQGGAVESGNRIRAVRKGKGMSARELADRMTEAGHRFSYTAITKIENQQRTLHRDTLEAIAKVLGVAPDTLIDTAAPTQKVPVIEADELIDVLVSGQDIESEHEIAVVSDGRLVGLTGLKEMPGVVVVDIAQKDPVPGKWLVSEKGRLHIDELIEGDHSKQPPASGAMVGYIIGQWIVHDERIPYRDVQRSEAEQRHDEEEGVESFIRRRLKPK